MPCPARHMHLSPRRRCDHPPRLFLEHGATKFHTISRSTRLLSPASRNYFPAESKPFAETIDAARERRVSTAYASINDGAATIILAVRRDAPPYRSQQPHDAHAMSIPPQSCSLYPEGKRAPCLSGVTRPFFAQCFSGSLDRVRRKARSTFSGNSHKQATLPFELHG
jgi:hypothetical protein